jgi:hypothetical protein
MKTKYKELDVDFIGGQDSMTKEEEKHISEFLKSHKLLRNTKLRPTKKEVAKRQSPSLIRLLTFW